MHRALPSLEAAVSRAVCSLEAAVQRALGSLHAAVPQALGSRLTAVSRAQRSLECAVPRALGSLEAAVPRALGSLESAVTWALWSLEAPGPRSLGSPEAPVPRSLGRPVPRYGWHWSLDGLLGILSLPVCFSPGVSGWSTELEAAWDCVSPSVSLFPQEFLCRDHRAWRLLGILCLPLSVLPLQFLQELGLRTSGTGSDVRSDFSPWG